jgi:hypothetical protein
MTKAQKIYFFLDLAGPLKMKYADVPGELADTPGTIKAIFLDDDSFVFACCMGHASTWSCMPCLMLVAKGKAMERCTYLWEMQLVIPS